MEILTNLLSGFAIALQPENLLFCFIGVLLGTLIGVLPGIGPTAGIAMLIPISSGLDPTTAIIMLAGLYYGSMYGGSTTAILINAPGEAASVITAVDGFKMAKQGRAGAALSMAAIASFVAGTVSLIGLMLLAPPLSELALIFGPPEYFALMLLGLTIVIGLAGKSLNKGLISAGFGLMLATIGIDPQVGSTRFTFDTVSLMGGIDFISVVVGLFAVTEVLQGIEEKAVTLIQTKIKNLLPTKQDWKDSSGALARGSLIGFFVGILPGASSSVASFIAYDVEKKVSKTPEKFGQGAIAGVAAPEGANNSATGGGMVPLLTLGIPSSAPLAILLGALMVHGLRPGPLLFQENPGFVWGLIASMYIGNVMLLLLNLPLVGWWAKLATIPFPVLGPMILIFCFIGTYGVRNSMFDVWITLLFGVIGYIIKKVHIPAVPMVLAIILGPMLEQFLRQALTMSKGDPSIFFTRPISLVLILLAAASVGFSLYSRRKNTRLVTSGVLESEEA